MIDALEETDLFKRERRKKGNAFVLYNSALDASACH